MLERPLVVGGDSKLGSALLKALAAPGVCEHPAIATTRRGTTGGGWFPLDLSIDEPKLPTWSGVVYLIAAVTKVVDCEADPQSTWRVNADGPVALALEAARDNRHVVFVSSDAVERAPNLNYSRQKAYVEGVVLPLGGTVVRPSRIPPDKIQGLVDLMIHVGRMQSPGLFRWSP